MKKVYLAQKEEYRSSEKYKELGSVVFYSEFLLDTYDSLRELKLAVFNKFAPGREYNDWLLEIWTKDYGICLYEVDLHDDDDIIFDDYEGFIIVNKSWLDPTAPESILSTMRRIEL